MLLFSLIGCGAGASPAVMPRAEAPRDFWSHWGDGKAELDGYAYTARRYGELRTGEEIQVWVTEDFTAGQLVKSNGGHGDEFPVLKLNDIRRFQTGIYDYHLLQSVFVRADGKQALGLPVKEVLSVDEWCGAAFEELVVRDGVVHGVGHSYFDGEGDRSWDDERVPAMGVMADALPYLARGLLGDPVAPGASVAVQLRHSQIDQRLAHREPAWVPATLSRAAEVESVEVPAGTFEVRRFEVTTDDPACGTARGIAADGTTCKATWWVEEAAPHRIVRWSRDNGEDAVLTGSFRGAYWSMHGEGQEEARRQLGLGLHPYAPAP
ncbi:MAG: hypothetical protein H6738_19250 [Alphaproteobacteria bacterium]|nr:hypothetical protein [Alphaproteobacteria bacterium]